MRIHASPLLLPNCFHACPAGQASCAEGGRFTRLFTASRGLPVGQDVVLCQLDPRIRIDTWGTRSGRDEILLPTNGRRTAKPSTSHEVTAPRVAGPSGRTMLLERFRDGVGDYGADPVGGCELAECWQPFVGGCVQQADSFGHLAARFGEGRCAELHAAGDGCVVPR